MARTEVEFVFHDYVAQPINGLHYIIKANGVILAEGATNNKGVATTLNLFTSEAEKKKFIILTNKHVIALNTVLDVFVKSDSGEEVAITEASKPIDAKYWGQVWTRTVTSPWAKVPLNEAASKRSAAATTLKATDKGFFQVEYKERDTGAVKEVVIYVDTLPKRIIQTALKYAGSTAWGKSVSRTAVQRSDPSNKYVLGEGTNKCSLFVHDVISEVGLDLPWMERGRYATNVPWVTDLGPPIASDWGSPGQMKKNWISDTSLRPGDVGAYKVDWGDASGHCGFVVAHGVTVSAGGSEILVNDAGFRVEKFTPEQKKKNDALPNTSREHDFSLFRRHISLKK